MSNNGSEKNGEIVGKIIRGAAAIAAAIFFGKKGYDKYQSSKNK